MKNYLQRIGSSILLPISVIPVASILMGIGYWISPGGMSGESSNAFAVFLIQAGMALISKLPILFAVGIATGMSRDKSGAAGISGLVSFLVVTYLLAPDSIAAITGQLMESVEPAFYNIDNAFIGILCGVVGAELYNRFHHVKLPMALAFFSGKRLVPILSAGTMLVISGILFLVWPLTYNGLVAFGTAVSGLGSIGAGIYGFGNKILIPVGLHHALNAVFMQNVAGINDLVNFWSSIGVKGITGRYMAGFFPVMMFGLPAAALAIYKNAKPERKKEVASLMIAGAVASFFTGITEPIEFAILFAAPSLYVLHAVLTGVVMVIAAQMQWIAGFSFSSGLIDYVLSFNMPLANHPGMLLVLGAATGIVYFILFDFLIRRFDLKTPGREDVLEETSGMGDGMSDKEHGYGDKAAGILRGLGSKENIEALEHCATRLRIQVKHMDKVNEEQIKQAGGLGVVKINQSNLQVIIGPDVQFIFDEMQKG